MGTLVNDKASKFLTGASALGYLILLVLLYPELGGPVATLAFLPVVAAGLLWGLWAGLVVGLLSLPFNMLLVVVFTEASLAVWLDPANLLAHMVVPIVGALAGRFHDMNERVKEQAREMEYRALHDPLTGLPNRVLFLERLEYALAGAANRGGRVAVLFLDLDNFKYVNDSIGHRAGDGMLVAVAERLRKCLRPEDTIARFGGDEFIVLLHAAGGMEEDAACSAERTTEEISEALQSPVILEGQEVNIGASIGISLGGAGASAEELLRDADAAMYAAKDGGKATHSLFHQSMNQRARERLRLENNLRRALKRKELALHYQPKVSLKTGRIVGMEALARWEDAELGLVSPAKFIPAAEETGLIVPFGRWVLEEACQTASTWQQAYPDGPPLPVCVNLSTKQLRRPELVEEVDEVLRATGIDPQGLELEITESVIMDETPSTVALLHRLKGLGVNLAIDDFGTGYSSLSYLKSFPIDFLKLDISITQGLNQDPRNTAIASAAITLAHALGERVIAEGVETTEQLGRLRQLGCDVGQGYYFSEPLPKEAVGTLLSEISKNGPPWAPYRTVGG